MIGWLITGAVVVAALRAKAPAPAAPVVSRSPVLPPPVMTARVVAPVTRTPAAVTSIQPKPALPSPVVIVGGNEPIAPLIASIPAPDLAFSLSQIGSIDRSIASGIYQNIAIGLRSEQAAGTYSGYGVPLTPPPFQFGGLIDAAGSGYVDSGTFSVGSGLG